MTSLYTRVTQNMFNDFLTVTSLLTSLHGLRKSDKIVLWCVVWGVLGCLVMKYFIFLRFVEMRLSEYVCTCPVSSEFTHRESGRLLLFYVLEGLL